MTVGYEMVGYITSAHNVRTPKEVLTGPGRTWPNVCTQKEILTGPGRTRPKKPNVVPKGRYLQIETGKYGHIFLAIKKDAR